jgi:hypothetical protein
VLAVHVVTRFAVAKLWHPEGGSYLQPAELCYRCGNDLAAVDVANDASSDGVKDPVAINHSHFLFVLITDGINGSRFIDARQSRIARSASHSYQEMEDT